MPSHLNQTLDALRKHEAAKERLHDCETRLIELGIDPAVIPEVVPALDAMFDESLPMLRGSGR